MARAGYRNYLSGMEHFTPIIAVHASCAFFVLLLGPVQLLRRRRDRAHRLLGVTWVSAMVLNCVTSFFIHPHGLTWLHGLAAFTLFSVGLAMWGILHGDVRMHRWNMIGCYLGTLAAFGFAVGAPARAISQTFASSPVTLLGTALGITLLVAAWSGTIIRTHRDAGTQRTPSP